jgi:oligopeptide/dipeptide ABC transporter ATP-binding protein
MASVPSMTGELPDRLAAIGGSPPAGGTWPPGCAFAPRCPIARDLCSQADPELTELTDAEHLAGCHASHDESWGRAA